MLNSIQYSSEYELETLIDSEELDESLLNQGKSLMIIQKVGERADAAASI